MKIVKITQGKLNKKKVMLYFAEKISVNNFHLSDAEDSTPGPLNRGVYSIFTFLEKTIKGIPYVSHRIYADLILKYMIT